MKLHLINLRIRKNNVEVIKLIILFGWVFCIWWVTHLIEDEIDLSTVIGKLTNFGLVILRISVVVTSIFILFNKQKTTV